MKKIAILNDIHSNYLLLKLVLDDIQKYNVDDFIFCGDYVTDGFDYCCDFIQFINNFSCGNEKIMSELWHEKFIEYLGYKNLKIF